jgi:hypothetical protein
MKHRMIHALGLMLVLIFVVGLAPSCGGPDGEANSYVAVLPKVLHSGRTETVSLALFAGDDLTRDKVEVALWQGSEKIVSTTQTIDGRGTIAIDIPEVADGDYEIRVKGSGFSDG